MPRRRKVAADVVVPDRSVRRFSAISGEESFVVEELEDSNFSSHHILLSSKTVGTNIAVLAHH